MKKSVVSCGSSRSDGDICTGKFLRAFNRMSLPMRNEISLGPYYSQTIMYL